jgi:hypothetical protein
MRDRCVPARSEVNRLGERRLVNSQTKKIEKMDDWDSLLDVEERAIARGFAAGLRVPQLRTEGSVESARGLRAHSLLCALGAAQANSTAKRRDGRQAKRLV